jgi:riboflavin synthase
MFTGIVRERGRVARQPSPSGRGGLRFEIAHSEELSERLEPGASLAVSGVCLTAVELGPGLTVVELAPETVARTNLGSLVAGAEVNLEPALRVGDAMGGHWVQGHVDGTVAVLEVRRLEGGSTAGEHREMVLELVPALAPQVVEKGSVALDGVSLTVASRWPERFSVALIPHTLEVTTLGSRQPGELLNLEADILAKYVLQALTTMGVGR